MQFVVATQKFRLWKTAASSSRNQRALLKNVFAKMNGVSKRDVFTAWRSFCMIRREEKSKYLTGALANARNRLEQSLAREAALRDVVSRLEARVRRGSAGPPGEHAAAGQRRVTDKAVASSEPASLVDTSANKVLWDMNKQLVTALCKLGKTCLGNVSWSICHLESQQVAEVRRASRFTACAHAAPRRPRVPESELLGTRC